MNTEKIIETLEKDYGYPRKPANFKVGTYSLCGQDGSYCHWSEGLKMVIEKDGVVIKLEGEEIDKLIKSLPRTVGGVY